MQATFKQKQMRKKHRTAWFEANSQGQVQKLMDEGGQNQYLPALAEQDQNAPSTKTLDQAM